MEIVGILSSSFQCKFKEIVATVLDTVQNTCVST